MGWLRLAIMLSAHCGSIRMILWKRSVQTVHSIFRPILGRTVGISRRLNCLTLPLSVGVKSSYWRSRSSVLYVSHANEHAAHRLLLDNSGRILLIAVVETDIDGAG